MKKYFCQVKNAFNAIIYYRANTFFRFLRSMIIIFPQIFLWKALYSGHYEVAGITLDQMLTYTVLSRFVSIASNVGGASDIESRMKNGDIGIDLMRPASPRLLFMSQNLGSSFASLLLDGLPVLLASMLVLGGIQRPSSYMNFILFIISLAGAIVVNIMLQILLGTLSFWFLNMWGLNALMSFFDSVFSGRYVPLWFFPEWLKNMAMALPFQAIRFLPVAIYLGQMRGREIISALAIQAIWIVVLFLIQSLLWRRGLKRIVIMGG